jgi:hypothetical protein
LGWPFADRSCSVAIQQPFLPETVAKATAFRGGVPTVIKLSTVSDARLAAILWLALVAVGVAGRTWQPGWNVTPMAGVSLVAGAVSSNPLVAATVPAAALAISNLWLPTYGSDVLALVVFAAMIWPVLLGPLVRRGQAMALVGGALAHSLVFYLSTNLAHWLLTNDYPRTAAGLVACYVAALPFYRWMPVGDVVWTLVVAAGVTAVLRLRLTAGVASEAVS